MGRLSPADTCVAEAVRSKAALSWRIRELGLVLERDMEEALPSLSAMGGNLLKVRATHL